MSKILFEHNYNEGIVTINDLFAFMIMLLAIAIGVIVGLLIRQF